MSSRPTPFVFFALTGLLSLPFWGIGALTDVQLLPGLPISALMVVAPVISAGFLVHRTGGVRDVFRFLGRSIDFGRMRPWAWFVSIGTMPIVMVASGLWLAGSGYDLPAPQIEPVTLILLFTVFLVAALAEELGWSGYAARPLSDRYGLLFAGLVVGCVTVLWHVIPLLQAGRTWDWIAWWAIGTIARRIIILWLYMRGGESVFATALFHAMSNLSWMLFPVMGSHFDPVSTSTLLVCVAALVTSHDALQKDRRGIRENKG